MSEFYKDKPYKNTVAQSGKKSPINPQYTTACKSKLTPNKKIGVLLVNLGTPDNTTYWGIRKFLSEFLSDRRVIHMSPIMWQPILQGIILSIRPQKIAHAYKSIWNTDFNESPLLTTTRSQAKKLHDSLNTLSDDIIVDFAMRYGNPSIDSKMKKLINEGCSHILIMPLYPQYSASTTASVNDAVFASLIKMTNQPSIRILPPYYKDDAYITALNKNLTETLKDIDFKAEKIVSSYHGIPKQYHMEGDPYPCHCKVTSRLLSEKSGLEITTTFQSIFGKQEWVKPYTEASVVEMAQLGIKNIVMTAPAFATDCLETLEEIQYEIKDAFIEAGGEKFAYVPCLNDTDVAIDMYTKLAIKQLSGWIEKV